MIALDRQRASTLHTAAPAQGHLGDCSLISRVDLRIIVHSMLVTAPAHAPDTRWDTRAYSVAYPAASGAAAGPQRPRDRRSGAAAGLAAGGLPHAPAAAEAAQPQGGCGYRSRDIWLWNGDSYAKRAMGGSLGWVAG